MRPAFIQISAYFLVYAVLAISNKTIADVLKLADGTVIEGELISETPDGVTFNGKIAGIWGIQFFESSRVDRVTRVPGDQGPPRGGDAAKGKETSAPAGTGRGDRGAAADGLEPVKLAGSGENEEAARAASVASLLRVEVKRILETVGPSIRVDPAFLDRVQAQLSHTETFIRDIRKDPSSRRSGGVYRFSGTANLDRSALSEAVREYLAREHASGQPKPASEPAPASIGDVIRNAQEKKDRTKSVLVEAFANWPVNVLSCRITAPPKPIADGVGMKRVKEGEAGIRVWVDIEVAPDKWKAWADASIQMLDRAGLQRAQATWRAAEAVAYQRGEVSDSDIIQGQEDELLREGLHLPRSLYLRDKPVLKLEWTEWRLRSRTAPVPVARNAFGGISDVAIQLDGEARLGDRDVRGASYIIAIQPAFDSQAVLYRLPTGLPPQVLGEVPAEVRESRGADRSYFFGPRRLRVLLRAFDKAGKEVALGARPFEHDLSGSDIGISPIPAVFRLGVGVARTAASSPMFQTRWGLLLPLLTKEMVPGFVVGSAGAAYPIDLVLPISIATEIDRFEPELYLSETTK